MSFIRDVPEDICNQLKKVDSFLARLYLLGQEDTESSLDILSPSTLRPMVSYKGHIQLSKNFVPSSLVQEDTYLESEDTESCLTILSPSSVRPTALLLDLGNADCLKLESLRHPSSLPCRRSQPRLSSFNFLRTIIFLMTPTLEGYNLNCRSRSG